MIFATWASQWVGSPAWQCPMPARVRRRMCWVVSTEPPARWTASTISDSVTFSHLHITFFLGSIEGSSALPSFSPFHPRLGTMIGGRIGSKSLLGVEERPDACSMLTISMAMAGEPASPGESIPAAWKNFLQASLSSMIQSPRSDLARAPAKEWYVSPASNDGTSSRHRCSTNSKICFGVMSRSSGLCMSRAVGPSIRLPQRVVCTSTPLPFTGSGAGKRVAPARWPWDLFNIR
mmetsp:Transcript_39199/g.124799  ORF Transcript_39199/g.124799 Transcript_39199/m.124799 type:complete len:234 (+) Transcript_39199:3010-3711(+)